ncbi:MAG: pyrroline-5-carboxylate reductase [Nevskiales bacterium]
MQHDIIFIGGGNMAASLIGGLLADGYAASRMRVVEPLPERRAWLTAQFQVTSLAEPPATLAAQDVVVLAVKPQIMAQAARGLAPAVQANRPLVISIAAGIRCTDLDRWLGGKVALVRSMPNTPALIRCGASALYATATVGAEQRIAAEHILRAVGLTLWVEDEKLLDAVTALSGSGPAYFFLFMEALQRAGMALGLPADAARLLTLQTALGTARMAMENSEPPETLRAQVTSKGGTTERAVQSLLASDLPGAVHKAVAAAAQRSRELAEQFGAGS